MQHFLYQLRAQIFMKPKFQNDKYIFLKQPEIGMSKCSWQKWLIALEMEMNYATWVRHIWQLMWELDLTFGKHILAVTHGVCVSFKIINSFNIWWHSLLEASIDSIHVMHHFLQVIYADVILHFKREVQPVSSVGYTLLLLSSAEIRSVIKRGIWLFNSGFVWTKGGDRHGQCLEAHATQTWWVGNWTVQVLSW